MRPLPVLAAATLLATLLGPAAPALAHGDPERNELVRSRLLAEGTTTPLMSDNVALQSSNPGTVGISGCFLQTAPLYVTSGLEAVTVWDVGDATRPERVGVLPNAVFENEAMTCGERRTRDGEVRRFALVGVDLYQAAPDDPEHVNAGGNELVVVDVTDPAAPTIVGRAPAQTSTHTVACVDETNCRYAYSAGDSGSGTFSVFDLRNLRNPREVDARPRKDGVQAFPSPTAGHKWNFDAAGVGTHTGFDGSSMWSTDRPRRPRLLATTGKAGGAGDADGADGYNDFIHHNSFRPRADRFRPRSRPSYRNGNVLLVTEEDYEQTDCSKAGSFQTWHVRRLNGKPGGIVPLDKVELSDLGNFPAPQGAFCSAHWFDFRKGIVAAGFYGGGMQLVDARRPRRLRTYGHAHWFASEVWDAMWVPVYKNGRNTGRSSNVVYSIDLVRGLDVYSVDVPGRVGIEPMRGTSTSSGLSDRASSGVVPFGVVAGAVGIAAAVRRRTRRARPGS
jgi:hypothetical protein